MHSIPIILQDLPPEDTHRLICTSLLTLQTAAEDIFERIQTAAEQERELLQSVSERLLRVEQDIERLSTSRKALKSTSLATYPEQDLLHSSKPLFASEGKDETSDRGPVVHLPSVVEEGAVRGQDTIELFHFFKQSHAAGPDVSIKGAASTLPANVKSVTSLKEWNRDQAAYRGQEAEQPQEDLSLALSQDPAARAQLPRNVHLAAVSAVSNDAALQAAAPPISLPESLPLLDSFSRRPPTAPPKFSSATVSLSSRGSSPRHSAADAGAGQSPFRSRDPGSEVREDDGKPGEASAERDGEQAQSGIGSRGADAATLPGGFYASRDAGLGRGRAPDPDLDIFHQAGSDKGLSVSDSMEAALGTLGAEHTELQKSVMSRQRSLNSRSSLDMLDSSHYRS